MALDESQLGPAIERAGYKYVNGSGYGASALWVAGEWTGPNGDTFVRAVDPDTRQPYPPETQEQIANELFPSSSPYLRTNQPKDEPPSKAPDTFVDASGQGWRWDPRLDDYVEDDRFDDPRKAVGYVAPRAPAAGPSALDYAKEERARRESDAQIRKYEADGAREDVKLRILLEQNRVAEEAGRRSEAREIARDIDAVQSRRDSAYARVEELNAAALNRAAEFNAQASETAAQRQEAARQANIAGQRQNAVDIANFQQMPGDVGMLGAYLAARQGEGGSPISTAIGQGENFITDRSLSPLGTLLDTREQLSRPTIFSAARYDPALLAQMPQQAPLIQRQAPAPTQAPSPNGLPTQEQYGAAGGANPGGLTGLTPEQYAAVPDFVKTTGPSGEPLGAVRSTGEQAMESAPSITLDTATGQWMSGGQVVNPFDAAGNLSVAGVGGGGAPAAPAPAPAPVGGGGYSGGGAVQAASAPLIQRQSSYQPMTVTYGEPTQRNPGARIFQRQAAAEARDRSGLRGDLTPIAFSDPGTDPFLAELAASVTAAERGVDRNLFERERKRLAPRRMPVYGRTR